MRTRDGEEECALPRVVVVTLEWVRSASRRGTAYQCFNDELSVIYALQASYVVPKLVMLSSKCVHASLAPGNAVSSTALRATVKHTGQYQ